MHHEPILGSGFDSAPETLVDDPAVVDCIRELVGEEPFAVLCTQGGGQSYGSVVALAFSRDLRSFVFATPTTTRKYRLLSECDRVALVVDNRGTYPDDLMKIGAITVTGLAHQVEPGQEFELWAGLPSARHSYLRSCIDPPSTALFPVDVIRIRHATRFQEVRQWLPASDG
jgi:hypothetical protein